MRRILIRRFDGSSEITVFRGWRGVATATASDKPTKNMEKMNKALDKMFEKFPITGRAVSTSGKQ